ncbi:MAG: hypothetical protein U5N55_12835 [Cypionkella sp.]|nr:hypothetical protein [Cypionkella sp.]
MKTAAELIAPLASPIIAQGAGERFINPAMANGALLDATVGTGWRLFYTADLPQPHLPQLAALDIRILAVPKDPEGHLDNWCKDHGAAYILVRPDHYVAACAPDAETLHLQLSTLFGSHFATLAAE